MPTVPPLDAQAPCGQGQKDELARTLVGTAQWCHECGGRAKYSSIPEPGYADRIVIDAAGQFVELDDPSGQPMPPDCTSTNFCEAATCG